MEKLKVNQNIYFIGENLPMIVMAVSERYAVVVRNLSQIEDDDLLRREVEMSAFNSSAEAYDYYKNSPIYSIIDFEKNIKAPHNLIFNDFDFFKEQDCEEAIQYLVNGEMELSRRNQVELKIDWEKTSQL